MVSLKDLYVIEHENHPPFCLLTIVILQRTSAVLRRTNCSCNSSPSVMTLRMDFWVAETNDVMDLTTCFISLFCVSMAICRYLYWFKMAATMDWWANMDPGGYLCKISTSFFSFTSPSSRSPEVTFRATSRLPRIFLVFRRIRLAPFSLFRAFVLKFPERMVLLLWAFWLASNQYRIARSLPVSNLVFPLPRIVTVTFFEQVTLIEFLSMSNK